jgi:hypothetical protein
MGFSNYQGAHSGRVLPIAAAQERFICIDRVHPNLHEYIGLQQFIRKMCAFEAGMQTFASAI